MYKILHNSKVLEKDYLRVKVIAVAHKTYYPCYSKVCLRKRSWIFGDMLLISPSIGGSYIAGGTCNELWDHQVTPYNINIEDLL